MTYTVSLDLISNIECSDIVPILYRLINRECEHNVAIDAKMKLLSAYVDKAKHPRDISSWIGILSDTNDYITIDYDFEEDAINDKNIMAMTAKVVGARKMIVHSLQSVTYTDVNSDNEAVVDGNIVPIITKDVAVNELNHKEMQINNYVNSQIATEGSTITRSNITQK